MVTVLCIKQYSPIVQARITIASSISERKGQFSIGVGKRLLFPIQRNYPLNSGLCATPGPVGHLLRSSQNDQSEQWKKRQTGFIFDGKDDRIVMHASTVSNEPDSAYPEKQDGYKGPEDLGVTQRLLLNG